MPKPHVPDASAGSAVPNVYVNVALLGWVITPTPDEPSAELRIVREYSVVGPAAMNVSELSAVVEVIGLPLRSESSNVIVAGTPGAAETLVMAAASVGATG